MNEASGSKAKEKEGWLYNKADKEGVGWELDRYTTEVGVELSNGQVRIQRGEQSLFFLCEGLSDERE